MLSEGEPLGSNIGSRRHSRLMKLVEPQDVMVIGWAIYE